MTETPPCPSPSPGTPPTTSRSAAAHGPRPHPEFSPIPANSRMTACAHVCAVRRSFISALCPLDSRPTPVHTQCCSGPSLALPGPAASVRRTRNSFLRLCSHAPSPSCAETSPLPRSTVPILCPTMPGAPECARRPEPQTKPNSTQHLIQHNYTPLALSPSPHPFQLLPSQPASPSLANHQDCSSPALSHSSIPCPSAPTHHHMHLSYSSAHSLFIIPCL